jgi:hypothetical protein
MRLRLSFALPEESMSEENLPRKANLSLGAAIISAVLLAILAAMFFAR